MADEEPLLRCMTSSGLTPEEFGAVLYDACHRPMATSQDVELAYQARVRIRSWDLGDQVLRAEQEVARGKFSG